MKTIRWIAAGIAAVACAQVAQAQSYPSKPIKVIVPFAAGSGTDVMTRQVTNHMAGTLKTTFVIDNKTGANGVIGAQAAAQSPADGYTLFVGSISTHSANPYLLRKLPYDAVNGFDAVGLIGFTAPVLLRGAEVPAKTVRDVIEMAKKSPGAVSFATSNTSSLFATQMFAHQAGTTVNLVRYSSTPQAHTDVAAGQLPFVFGDFTAAAPHLQSGKLKAIAVASPTRLAGQPDVPTLAEAGLPGVEVQIWIGLFAPKGVPREAVEKLNGALNAALATSEIKADLVRLGAMTAQPTTLAGFQQYVLGQYVHWGRMAKTLAIQPE